MSREKDFIEAAERLAETKRTEDAKQQCLYDFGIAADYGYQYAKKRLREVLGFELDFNVAEFDDGVTTESLVDKILKRMEE